MQSYVETMSKVDDFTIMELGHILDGLAMLESDCMALNGEEDPVTQSVSKLYEETDEAYKDRLTSEC